MGFTALNIRSLFKNRRPIALGVHVNVENLLASAQRQVEGDLCGDGRFAYAAFLICYR